MPRVSTRFRKHNSSARHRSSIRTSLWRWHRRIGLVAAVFVLLLAVTGILINHTDALKLNSAPLPHFLRTLFYQVESPDLASADLGGQWLTQVGGAQLYRDRQPLAACDGDLVGAIRASGPYFLVACQNELQLYSTDWQLIERVGAYQQLPTPLQSLGQCGDSACFRLGAGAETQAGIYRLNLDVLTWKRVEEDLAYTPVALRAPPGFLSREIATQYLGDSVSWERWLLDLHSGRFMGAAGPWVMDFAAILFIISALTGFSAWWLSAKKRRL